MKLNFSLKLFIAFSCLVLSSAIFGQDSLKILAKLDAGLPLSGLNVSSMGDIISCIGDVNNDGFDDWAVGFPYAADYETGATTGKVLVYFGSNAIQSNQLPDLILTGEKGNYNFGSTIAGAGDVNNDGYSDVLVTKNQQLVLYFGGNPMDSTPDVLFTDENETRFFGVSISGGGDVNNDGFDDIVIGSKNFANIFLGGDSVDSQVDIVLKGETEGDLFGFSVSLAGDVNNDGFDDLIVGAQGYYLNGYDAGRVYVFFGGTEMDTIPDLLMTGEHPDDSFGSTVTGAGDLNNDGFADILVDAYRYKNADGVRGHVYIYYGGDEKDTIADVFIKGSSGGQSAGDINKDGFDDLLISFIDVGINNSIYWGGSPMDNIPDFVMTNVSRVAGSGDYNNDGFADILTGAPNDATNGDYSGSVSIFFGGNQPDVTPDIQFFGSPANYYFGSSVSSAGDINDDGYDDIIIGIYGSDLVLPNAGAANIYLGGKTIKNEPDFTFTGQKADDFFGYSVSRAGDVNNNGFSEFLVGSLQANQASLYLWDKSADTLKSITFKGSKSDRRFGNCVSPAGDFNVDGFDDFLIADYCNSVKGTNVGRVYLYYGGSEIDTNPDLTFEGEAALNNFGTTVACAGDVNGDGISDIMVGAPGFDRVNFYGRIYIYYGNSVPDTIPDVVIDGFQKYPIFGYHLAPAGDVNNDGFDDVIASVPFSGSSPYGMSYLYIFFGGKLMDNVPDFIIEKMAFGFGDGVSGAGDLNNDGFDDIVAGNSEKTCFYFGGAPMDTIPDLFLYGKENRMYEFGTSLALAGDMNNDGKSELLVGAPYSNAVGSSMGRVYIYSAGSINSGVEIEEKLSQNQVYPNPFDRETTIKYNVQKSGKVLVKIFNISGQEVATLANQTQPVGEYKIKWQPVNLPDGIYFCKIQSAESSETFKLLYQK